MGTSKPPFRADQVGSLLRPQELKDARARYLEGRLPAAELRTVEDRLIRDAVSRQEATGLKAVTDGEFRRAWWHFDFLAGLDGVELVRGPHTATLTVTGQLGFPGDHPMLEHFRFLDSTTGSLAKMTIPSPSILHFRAGRPAIPESVYPDWDVFFEDAARTYAAAIRAFHDAGCRYLQLDDTVWGYLCSEREREFARHRGDDPDRLPEIYARVINRALEAKPDDMTITMHVCRGNYRSSWIAEGGYEPVAETLLAGIEVDGYFLEYDSERAGGFKPLRFLPRGDKKVVLGLVTSKSGALEDQDDLMRRIEEAAGYVPLGQLCLSPQCGFASTEEGNLLSEDDQWRKLELVVATAEKVWPDC
jgi:5-methyltetrahydropteroyltriglutamate--homocysteine methyltransferase